MSAQLDFPVIAPEPTAVATQAQTVRAVALAHFSALEAPLRTLAERYRAVAFDCSTAKGMEAAKKARHDLRENGRFAVQRAEAAFKTAVNDAKKAVDGKADELVAIVRPFEDAIHLQIQAREEQVERERQERAVAEAARQQKHRDAIAVIAGYVAKADGLPSARIQAGIEYVRTIDVSAEVFEDFADRAAEQKAVTIERLEAMLARTLAAEEAARQAEAQRIENERVAAELAARQATLDAEAKALRERQAAIEDEDALVRSLHHNSRRIEGSAVAYVQKAIAYFEAGAKDWQDDDRPRVREAVDEGRRYLEAQLAAAMEAETKKQAAAQRMDAPQAGPASDGSQKPNGDGSSSYTAPAKAGREYTEARDSQQVLKAEPATADATDRDAPANASPRVGAMGAGQAADAAPAGGEPITQDAQESGSLPGTPGAYASSGAEAAEAPPSGDEGKDAHAEERAADARPPIKLGDICDRLGFTVTAAFVTETLGIQPAGTDKRAVLFAQADFPRIIDALIAHLNVKKASY